MNSVIRGTEFNYIIDKEGSINYDGFIAEGTESIVFKGVKYGGDIRCSCALKFKPKTRLYDFMNREYKILESMQTCRSVVRILDVIEDLGNFVLPYHEGEINANNFFCVIEEYIDGESLQDYCIKQWFTYNTVKKKFERNTTEYSYREIVKFQNQIIQFMINLCEIMKFVSNVNVDNGKIDSNKPTILHCDIKPENIMVTKHGKELVLIDFGRSQEFMNGHTFQHYSDRDKRTFTADYSDKQWQDVGKENLYAYGTVGYAAPECYAEPTGGLFPFISQRPALRHGCVSIESDIFGFGATFFECLSIYRLCTDAFTETPDLSNPRFFNDVIMSKYEDEVRNGATASYCDKDFRDIDIAYHEAIEDILRKCTRTRWSGFQDSENLSNEYYHNFYQLQSDIERARDKIPSLDRKSDPLVRQMLGISGFCAAFSVCFLVLWFLLFIFANPLARGRWNTLKNSYTDNQNGTLRIVAEDMMEVWNDKTKLRNYEDVIEFMYGGTPNDSVIDSEEAEILTDLLRDYVDNTSEWCDYINVIMKYAKSDNLDEISKNIYRLNLSDKYKSDGYELAKAITQVNDADDSDTEKLYSAYETLLKYAENSDYNTAVSKLAIKLMSGRKTDTIAVKLGNDRETIQNILASLSKIGGD